MNHWIRDVDNFKREIKKKKDISPCKVEPSLFMTALITITLKCKK